MGNALVPEKILSVVAYESMCKWIAESESLGDCKDIADKTAALKEYARRIKNVDAEVRASNVRLIAERRYGELLKQLARATPAEAGAKGGDAKAGNLANPAAGHATPYAQALTDTGVSRQAASRYQALADVPKKVFDDAIRSGSAPSIRKIIDTAGTDKSSKMPSDSLWLWGRMRDFETDKFPAKNLTKLLEPMTESMRRDVKRIAPLMADFFNQLTDETK